MQCAAISNRSARGSNVKFLTEKVTRAKNLHHTMKVELQDVDLRDQKKSEKEVNDTVVRPLPQAAWDQSCAGRSGIAWD